MINSTTYLIKGWKVTGDKADDIYEKLSDVCEEEYNSDICDILDSFHISDSMSGEYFYFGAILGSLDNDDGYDDDIEITDKLIEDKFSKFEDMCEKYPKIARVLGKYAKCEPKLYVVLNFS